MRVRWLAVLALGVIGCESLRNPPVPSPAPLHVAANPPAVATEVIPVAAARPGPRTANAPPPAPQSDPLTLAAEALERGDCAAAAVHLEAYVRAHPEQLMFRAQLGELLVRTGRDDAAKIHFERFVADAQGSTGAAKDHLVHAHTRLMEIALRGDDRFAEEFHRGVGLLLLVKEQDADAGRDDGLCEEMLCNAMKALRAARELNPGDVRARAYLAEVYDRTGNRRAADAERTAARGGVVAGELTPMERQRIALGEPGASATGCSSSPRR